MSENNVPKIIFNELHIEALKKYLNTFGGLLKNHTIGFVECPAD